MRFSSVTVFAGLVGFVSLLQAQAPPAGSAVPASDAKTAGQPAIVIPKEPLTIDPVSTVPPALAKEVSVEFKETALKDVVKWLQEEQKLPLVLDQNELQNAGILLNDPVSDTLTNDPLYLLLDRLQLLNLGWYPENGLVHLTTIEAADTESQTSQMNIGDLLDAGYDGVAIIEAIKNTTRGPWDNIDGDGGEISLLGDVLFLHQTNESMREVAGLLEALRRHGRRTFAFDSPKHAAIREKLTKPVSIAHQDAKLSAVLSDLSKQSGITFRFDREVEDRRVSFDRTPISLHLTEQKLQPVLEAVLKKLTLAWILRDGVLWITSEDEADAFEKTAVFDVRDLCRNESESAALQNAIQQETRGPWGDIDGSGGAISFPRPGTMVARGRERSLDEVLELLENYRSALRASKPRTRPGRDPQEVIVRFYKLPDAMAMGMSTLLPELVRPETWKTAARQDGVGSLRIVSLGPQPHPLAGSPNDKGAPAMAPEGVLIVTQTRAVQREVAEFLQKVQSGTGLEENDLDESPRTRGGMGGMGGGGFGGGGGGFGSGFFQVREGEKTKER